MGVVIVIIGGIVVLCRTLLGAVTGIRDRSTVELFVAALQHQNQGEFDGMQEQSQQSSIGGQACTDDRKAVFNCSPGKIAASAD